MCFNIFSSVSYHNVLVSENVLSISCQCSLVRVGIVSNISGSVLYKNVLGSENVLGTTVSMFPGPGMYIFEYVQFWII